MTLRNILFLTSHIDRKVEKETVVPSEVGIILIESTAEQ